MARMVNCVKLGLELPGLERPPYSNEFGQRIYDNISQKAWDMWIQQATLLINHYGLTLADPEAQDFMKQQVEEYFFGDDAPMPEGWTPAADAPPGARRKK